MTHPRTKRGATPGLRAVRAEDRSVGWRGLLGSAASLSSADRRSQNVTAHKAAVTAGSVLPVRFSSESLRSPWSLRSVGRTARRPVQQEGKEAFARGWKCSGELHRVQPLCFWAHGHGSERWPRPFFSPPRGHPQEWGEVVFSAACYSRCNYCLGWKPGWAPSVRTRWERSAFKGRLLSPL